MQPIAAEIRCRQSRGMFFGDLILKIEKTATCNQLKNIKNSKIKAVFWISIKCKLKEIPKHQDLSVYCVAGHIFENQK